MLYRLSYVSVGRSVLLTVGGFDSAETSPQPPLSNLPVGTLLSLFIPLKQVSKSLRSSAAGVRSKLRLERVAGIEPASSAWKAEVLPLNYTRLANLPVYRVSHCIWRKFLLQISLPHKSMVEGEGFEPSKAKPSDLQSDPFDHSGTPPATVPLFARLANRPPLAFLTAKHAMHLQRPPQSRDVNSL